MAWSFNNTTKILTSTGATLASPDSLLAGIALVQAADTTRGYVNSYIGWINNVFISINTGSFIQFDADSQIEFRGSTYMKISGSTGGGIIHGYRSTLLLNATTSRVDAAASLPTGSTFISLKERPNDPSARIIAKHTIRYDYPTILKGNILNTVNIDGLDFYANSAAFTVLKIYFGQATNSNVNNLRFFNFGLTSVAQKYSTTYNNGYYESLTFNSETTTNNIIIDNKPIFYLSTPKAFTGNLWVGQVTINNPTFLNNCWDETTNLNTSPPGLDINSLIEIFYSYKNTFKYGLIPLENVKCKFYRTIRSSIDSPTWATPANETQTAITDVNGTYTEIKLLDFYRTGTSPTQMQRFFHELKARKYDYKTAGQIIFTNRFFYQGNVNLSAGYSEEVQMLEVPYLTLTEAQASALTGISIVANGTTTGTVTISENRTIAEIWQYYRYWISQFANFESVDSWDFDNSTLNLGGWAFITSSSITGNLITTSTITLNTGGYISGTYTSQNGIYTHLKLPNILEGSLYAREGYLLSYYSGVGGIDMIYKYTYPVPRYIRIAKAGYLPLEIPYTPSPNVITLDNVQVVDEVYNQIGIDPTTITEFSIKFDYIDYPPPQGRMMIWSDYIRVNAPTNETTLQRLYVWYRYYEALLVTWEEHKETGKYREIFHGFNRMSAIDKVNFTLNENFTNEVREGQFTILNESANPLKITGGTLTGITGGSVIDSESNSIFIDPNKSYIANSEFIVDKLNNIPTNTLTVPKFLALK